MGPARRLARGLALALVLVLVPALVPAIAVAQGTTPAPPPPGGGGAVASAPAGTAPATEDKKEKGEIGGFTFSDKGPRRAAAPTARRVVRRAGAPLATFPGFEQLPDGGSRLFVQLSQTVGVEQRVAPGSVTYVLKGAHLRVHNDSNALVTVHFNTPVFRARLTPAGNDLLFILELRSAATPTFKLQDNTDKTSTLMIDFAKGDFLVGDGNERLPSEQPPAKAAKRTTNAAGNGALAPSNNPGPTP